MGFSFDDAFTVPARLKSCSLKVNKILRTAAVCMVPRQEEPRRGRTGCRTRRTWNEQGGFTRPGPGIPAQAARRMGVGADPRQFPPSLTFGPARYTSPAPAAGPL